MDNISVPMLPLYLEKYRTSTPNGARTLPSWIPNDPARY